MVAVAASFVLPRYSWHLPFSPAIIRLPFCSLIEFFVVVQSGPAAPLGLASNVLARACVFEPAILLFTAFLLLPCCVKLLFLLCRLSIARWKNSTALPLSLLQGTKKKAKSREESPRHRLSLDLFSVFCRPVKNPPLEPWPAWRCEEKAPL